MTWLIVFMFFGAIGFISLATAVFYKETEYSRGMKTIAGIVSIGVLILNCVWTVVNSIHQVDARNVGVVRTFGKITGQVGEGFKIVAPWQTVEEWDIRLQVIELDTTCSNGYERCMDVGSIDGQAVYVSARLNIEVDTNDVQELARNIGQDYIQSVVLPRVKQVTKETTVKYTALDILQKREEIRHLVRTRLDQELRPYSIRVGDFLIEDVEFFVDFNKAIEAKVAAEQQALAAENAVRIREAEARQRAATAQGAADQLRIEAQGQADANRLISQSLTPQLIQFQAVQKLTDKVQIALIPSGQGIIIDPASLLRPQ